MRVLRVVPLLVLLTRRMTRYFTLCSVAPGVPPTMPAKRSKTKQGTPYPGMGKVWYEFLGKRQVTDSNVPARCGGSWPLVAAPPLLSLRGATFAAQRTPGLTVQTARRSSVPCTVREPGRPRASCVGGLWVVFFLSFPCVGALLHRQDLNSSTRIPFPPKRGITLAMYRFVCLCGAG